MCSRVFVLQEVEDHRIRHMKWYGCKPYTLNPPPKKTSLVRPSVTSDISKTNLLIHAAVAAAHSGGTECAAYINRTAVEGVDFQNRAPLGTLPFSF